MSLMNYRNWRSLWVLVALVVFAGGQGIAAAAIDKSDLNGDGLSDFVVGVGRHDGMFSQSGAAQVVLFFAMALLITTLLLYLYTRCLRSALVTLGCSVLARSPLLK